MTAVRYDASSGPSGGPTRGAIALRDHWREVTGLDDMGIYNPRRVRGSSTRWSIHASGRAVDFAANANDAGQKAKADGYIEFLIRHSLSFQCQYLIWNKRSWKSGRGWRKYSGASPHTDHVHVELNIDGGENLTLAKLRKQWGRDQAQQEDMDDMHAGEVIASYVEAYGAPNKQQGADMREWIHDLYGKPTKKERDDGVLYIRNLLGLS